MADKYGVKKSSLAKAAKAHTINTLLFSWRNAGRPPYLTRAEEASIVAYATSLQRGHFPIFRKMLKIAADILRAARQPPEGPVSDSWIARFFKVHPKLKVSSSRPVDIKRRHFESDLTAIHNWFDSFS